MYVYYNDVVGLHMQLWDVEIGFAVQLNICQDNVWSYNGLRLEGKLCAGIVTNTRAAIMRSVTKCALAAVEDR